MMILYFDVMTVQYVLRIDHSIIIVLCESLVRFKDSSVRHDDALSRYGDYSLYTVVAEPEYFFQKCMCVWGGGRHLNCKPL